MHRLRMITRSRRGVCAALGVGGALACSGVSFCASWNAAPDVCPDSGSPRRAQRPTATLALSAAEPTTACIPLEKRCLAELVGTAILVSGGCGVVCAGKYAAAGVSLFGTAAAWGLSVALAVYATRAISGAHLNPAVTCALVATGAAPIEEAAPYIGAQCLGATIAGPLNSRQPREDK